MIKKIVFLVALLWATVGVADQRSSDLLQRLSSIIDSYGSYEVHFTASAVGQMPDVKGHYVVSGDKYYINVDEREVYCNGKVKYEVDRREKEVVVDNVNPRDRNILSNPTKAFEFMDGSFSHTYKGVGAFAGKNCEEIVLQPSSKGVSISDIVLYLDKATGLPVGIKYRVEGISVPVEIGVETFEKISGASDSIFNYDRNKYKGYEVIDFR